MKGPYGLELNDGCKTCKVKGSGFFCQLPPSAVKDFDAIKSTATYPKGALLFVEKTGRTRGLRPVRRRSEALHQLTGRQDPDHENRPGRRTARTDGRHGGPAL